MIMGTGEPLDNYDNFLKFILWSVMTQVISIAEISRASWEFTGMQRFAEEKRKITLALSHLFQPRKEKILDLM